MKAFFATTTYPARRLWAGLVAFLIAVGSGHYYASDEEKMYDTTLRMWQAIQHLFNPTVPVDMPILTEYGPMQSLLALFTMPFGTFLTWLGPSEMQAWLMRLPSTWINAVMVANIAVILGWLSLQRRQSVVVAVAVALTYALATPALKYAGSFFSEPTAAFFLLVALLPALLPRTQTMARQRWYILCGFACVGALLSKIAVAPAVLVIGMAVGLVALADRDWRKLITWGSGAGAGAVVFLTYNLLARGDLLSSGYSSHQSSYVIDWSMIQTGIYGQFLSSGKSIFLYAPLLVLWPIGLWLQRRQWRWMLAPLGVIAAIVFVHTNVVFWHGDGAWGPRYLVLCLPMMVLPLGEVYTWLGQQTRAWRWGLLGVLCTLTALVQIAAIGINLNAYIINSRNEQTRYYDPSASPIVGHWRQLLLQLSDDWNVHSQTGVTLQGWSYSEGDRSQNEQFPRFGGPHATLTITPRNPDFAFLAGDYHSCLDSSGQMHLAINMDHALLIDAPACPPRLLYLLLPARKTTLVFDSKGVTVAGLPQHEWYATLGVAMRHLRVYDHHGDYPFWANLTPPSRMPTGSNAMRIWASDIRTEFYDLWWDYLLAPPSSRSAWPVVLVILAVIGGLGLLAGIPHLGPGKDHQTAEQDPSTDPR